MEEAQQVRALLKRYPSMFKSPELLDVYAGWVPPLVTLCAEIDDLVADQSFVFQFIQIKKKLGQCRIHFVLEQRRSDLRTDGALEKLDRCKKSVQQCVEAAQSSCASRCLVCGRTPAPPDRLMPTPLCKMHRRSEHLRDPWSLGKIRLEGRTDA
ncbi:hypothetical protein [Pseudorhodoferax sp. Leaf265]|uniref:hypothetical protein n=1 Tax=Pseudorhodoferax sp. Leaf265 TaxID=1736315 RepID=UPI0007014544|nr:hypothetical protein [Pseudorhodoferax sp. Leaf265]KQP12052.1 hypothetical protein ASF45_32110 [Pseudorhodoferax sp. Leaf265]